jgi:hypothetical protein
LKENETLIVLSLHRLFIENHNLIIFTKNIMVNNCLFSAINYRTILSKDFEMNLFVYQTIATTLQGESEYD